MSPRIRPVRLFVAAISLAALLATEGAGFLGVPWKLRMQTLWNRVAQTADERRVEESRLPFDPDYGPFLEAVRDATPSGSSIALFPPGTSELYTYQANYLLAPRRLVHRDSLAEADYSAVYGVGGSPGLPVPLPTSKGRLFRLR